jgi:predicted nucleotidyltransferase
VERLIRRVVALIVQSVDPDEVVLFGSYAKHSAGVASDLDFLVVGDFHPSRYLRVREVRGVLASFAIPIDLLLVTPAELAAAKAEPYSFYSSVRMHGVSVYSRPASPAGRAARSAIPPNDSAASEKQEKQLNSTCASAPRC